MGRLITVVFGPLVALLSLGAAPRVTVQQLADILASSNAVISDDEAAGEIVRLELKERLTSATLSRLEHGVGERTREALEFVADQSTFLDPPADEIALDPVPTAAEQQAMLEKAGDYVLHYVRVLPNLICRQLILRFDDSPLPEDHHHRKAFHLRDSMDGELMVREGAETFNVQNTSLVAPDKMRTPEKKSSEMRMTTSGEFGSNLATLFGARKSKFSWRRWEVVDSIRVSVFGYAVPESDSRLTVFWAGERGRGGHRSLSVKVAYRGEVSIDPTTGGVVRLTQQALYLPRDFPIQRNDTAVEYREVRLGGSFWLCPARSITVINELQLFGRDQVQLTTTKDIGPHTHYLNRIEFTNYRKFDAESTVF